MYSCVSTLNAIWLASTDDRRRCYRHEGQYFFEAHPSGADLDGAFPRLFQSGKRNSASQAKMFVPKQRSIIFDCQNDAAASRDDLPEVGPPSADLPRFLP